MFEILWTNLRTGIECYQRASIVLLDEATSSINPDNEVAIQQAIGELVEVGTQEQLLKKEGGIKNSGISVCTKLNVNTQKSLDNSI